MRVRFGEFVFDSASRELTRRGQAVRLAPKAFDLLQILIEERPRAVRKEQLRDRLWPDVVVEEANLKNLVGEIRAALGGEKVIRTVPRYGYAFAADGNTPEAATLLKAPPGVTMGTLGYMAPEQLSGGEVTPAADVFSLGVVRYEIASVHRRFEGGSATEIAAAILSKAPRPLTEDRRDTPPRLEAVISKALAKSEDERYPTASRPLEELRQISRETMAAAIRSDDAHAAAPIASFRPKLSRQVIAGAAGVLFLAIVTAGVWMAARSKRVRSAEGSIKTAERLLAQGAFPEAFETAVAAAAILPDNDRLREVISRSGVPVSIKSDPPGASVFLQRFKGPAERVRAGTTPLAIPRLAKADYIVTLEKDGHAPAIRPLPAAPLYLRGFVSREVPFDLRFKLVESAKVPAGMVSVGGGKYLLAGWSRPSDRAIELRDFLIDRYEVSNHDFEEFVRAGGYRRRELWKHPFVRDGKTLSFEEAMTRFRDTTGLPAPRSWVSGAPPAGRENHPVSDVTWYEAAAFAEWKGKKLPTIYQWEKAGRYPLTWGLGNSFPWGIVGEGVDTTARANYLGKGTMPVDSMPFGLSYWGASHMAGNLAEWCRNPKEPGYAARGGSWNDAVYAFGQTGSYPALYSSATLGFRCVKDASAADQGEFALSASGFVPAYQPVGDHAFAEIRSRYDYDKAPLNARVIETVETPDWRREKIMYTGVAGSKVHAYLYLPSGFRRPLQVIHFAPGGDVTSGWIPLTARIEQTFPPLIRGGRAVFAVVLEGYLERPRPPDFALPDSRSNQYVDYVVTQVTELRRGLDYLESREDLDRSRIALYGPSGGAWAGVTVTALETRYRSVLLLGASIHPAEATDAAAANRINFAPRIAAPKLMLHGRYDESAPLKSGAEPLFRLLREPKRLQTYDGGHVPPLAILVPAIQKWLDETLGPVEQ